MKTMTENNTPFVGDDYDYFIQAMTSVYSERAALLAFFTTWHPSVISYNAKTQAGYALLYVDTPHGQMTWHIAPNDMHLFNHVEIVPGDDPRAQWDGHTTEDKYRRFNDLLSTVISIRELVSEVIAGKDFNISNADPTDLVDDTEDDTDDVQA